MPPCTLPGVSLRGPTVTGHGPWIPNGHSRWPPAVAGSFSRGGAPCFAKSSEIWRIWAVSGTCRAGRLLPWLWIWRCWRILSMPIRRLRRPGDVSKGFALFQVLWGHDLDGEILSAGVLLLLRPRVVALPLLHLCPFFLHVSQGVSVRAPPLRAPSYVSPPVLPSHISDSLTASQPLHCSAHAVDPVHVGVPGSPIPLRLVPSVVRRRCCSPCPRRVLHQAWLCTFALSGSEVGEVRSDGDLEVHAGPNVLNLMDES